MLRKWGLVVAVAIGCVLDDHPLAAAPSSGMLVIQHVTLIDGTGAPAQPDRTVVIVGNRIKDIGPTGRVRLFRDAQVVDGSGKYLIPGLWDMHVHMRGSRLGDQGSFVKENEALLSVYLANGVTGVREMGGDMVETVLQWRAEIANGKRQGPRIVTCGPKLDGPKPTWPGSIPISTPQEARAAVRRVKASGADFIKVYSSIPDIPRDAYLAILEEAKRQKLRVTGHLTRDVLHPEASDAGQDFEHIMYVLRACTLKEKELAAGTVKADHPLRAVLDSFDRGAAQALLKKFVRNETWVTPTLDITLQLGQFAPIDDPRRMYLSSRMLATWGDRSRDRRVVGSPPVSSDLLSDLLKAQGHKSEELTRMMQEAGVPLLAGSDTGASNGKKYPGFSLHDELARLVSAGLTPMQALQTSTWNAAKWQGRLASLGSIQRGKLADLLLLDADPMEDIRNTTKIRAVISDGQLLDRARLDSMLAEAARSARSTLP